MYLWSAQIWILDPFQFTAASWEAKKKMALGEAATVAQLAGLSAGALIGLIVRAANTARMHKHNCNQFAQHVKMIGNLLDQLKVSELKKYPETREPLEQLEDALRRAYLLINSCQERSYLYLIAMGWSIVYQFRRAQEEIDRYLRIIPLIALLDNARVKVRKTWSLLDLHDFHSDLGLFLMFFFVFSFWFGIVSHVHCV